MRLRTLYLKQLNKMRNVVNSYNEKTVNWYNLSSEEQLVIENMVLIVGVLYNMCKVQLVLKSDDSDHNFINDPDINKAKMNANKVLSQMSEAA